MLKKDKLWLSLESFPYVRYKVDLRRTYMNKKSTVFILRRCELVIEFHFKVTVLCVALQFSFLRVQAC
jgi:hypothetical protein